MQWKKTSIVIPILIIFSPVLGRAQFVELKYVSPPQELLESQKFCFEISELAEGRNCNELTDFPTMEITKLGVLPATTADQIASLISDFTWIELSHFALTKEDVLNNQSPRVIPFVIQMRWAAKEVALPGLDLNRKSENVLLAFGFLHLNGDDNTKNTGLEVRRYGSTGDLPHLAQGLAEDQDANTFHQHNLQWLQAILEPILSDYLRSKIGRTGLP